MTEWSLSKPSGENGLIHISLQCTEEGPPLSAWRNSHRTQKEPQMQKHLQVQLSTPWSRQRACHSTLYIDEETGCRVTFLDQCHIFNNWQPRGRTPASWPNPWLIPNKWINIYWYRQCHSPSETPETLPPLLSSKQPLEWWSRTQTLESYWFLITILPLARCMVLRSLFYLPEAVF